MSAFNINQCVIKSIAFAVSAAALAGCGTPKDSSSSSDAQSSSVAVSSSSSVSSSSVVSSSSSSEPVAGAIFSDDFDGSTNLDAMWGDAGNVEVSTERAYSGTNSVKFSAAGNGYNRNYITLDLNGTDLTDEMYGRMMIWIDTPNGNGGDFSFIQGEGKPSDPAAPADTTVMYRYRVDGQNSNGNLMANYDTWIDANNDGQTDWLTDCWDHSNTQLPRQTWSCVEWRFDKDSNQMEFWLNGQEINEIFISNSGEGCVDNNSQGGMWTAPASFERLHLGIEQYHNGVPARTVFIDDVAVDTEQVGCPQ